METKIRNCIIFRFRVLTVCQLLIYLASGFSLTQAYALDPLLVIRADGKGFEQSLEGLKGELEEDFKLHEIIIDKTSSVTEINQKMEAVSPMAVVLMDNTAISLYKRYQMKAPTIDYVPSVAIMAISMDQALHGVKNGTGISYEVPIVTSVVNLRSVLDVPLERVGLVHRPFMAKFVKQNTQFCRKEGIELISKIISDKRNITSKLKRTLNHLHKLEQVDALWVPNDNVLVNAKLLKSVWLPFAAKFRKPIIVGVEVLVNPVIDFGTFAVIPDHNALGMQAAEKIFDVMENDWQVTTDAADPPRSVYKIINAKQAKNRFHVNEVKLESIDKVVQ